MNSKEFIKTYFLTRNDRISVYPEMSVAPNGDVEKYITKHIKGVKRLGFYCINKESKAKWGIIDCDNHEKNPEVGENHRQFKAALEKLTSGVGLPIYLEISKSGDLHIWFFFDEPIPAHKVRIFITGLSELAAELAGLPKTYVHALEIFPKQDRLEDGEFGNFVWLPGFGAMDKIGGGIPENKTVFVNGDGTYTTTPDIKLISGSRIEEVADLLKLGEISKEPSGKTSPETFSMVAALLEKGSTKGSRNNDTFEILRHLRMDGLSEELARAAISIWNRTNVHPPLEEKELGRVIQSVYSDKLPTPNRQVAFSEIQSAIHSYLRFEENADYIIDLALAVALSLAFEQPVWLMIIAPSSSGKTEILRLFKRVNWFHYLFNITPKTLFSGHPKARGGFIPREIGDAGILCFPDFTTVLSTRPDDRHGIFNQLRVTYDGMAGRGTGVDEGEMPHWEGRIAFIGGVTNSIERYKSRMTDLGERFIYFKHPTPPFDESYLAVEEDIIEETRDRISYLIRDFVSAKSPMATNYTIDPETEQFIVEMSKLISQARAAVDRDGYTKDITYVHEPEGIWRLRGELRILYRCLLCIHEGDVNRPLKILGAIVKSSIPELRVYVVEVLIKHNNPVATSTIATGIGLPTKSTRYVLEAMAAHKMIDRIKSNEGEKNVDRWQLTSEFKELWQNVFIPF